MPRCCFKSGVPPPKHAHATITSGVITLPPPAPPPRPPPPAPAPANTWTLTINGTSSGSVPGHVNKYPIASKSFEVAPDETTLSLRVVLDRSIIEAFAQGGRVSTQSTPNLPLIDPNVPLIILYPN